MLGVLLAITSNRFSFDGSFDQRVGEDIIFAVLRQTQESSFGLANVSLSIELSGASIVVSSIVSGATKTTRSFPTNEVAITAGTVGSGTSCSSISSTITLNFDSAGEIETVDDDGFPICLNGESSLCISPAGFAHEGACL